MSATALRRAASLRSSVFALPSMHAHNPGVIAQGESKTQDSNEDTVALGSVVTRYAFGLSRGHRRAHYDQDPDVNRHIEHPAALVPFETNPEWIAEARKATTETCVVQFCCGIDRRHRVGDYHLVVGLVNLTPAASWDRIGAECQCNRGPIQN